MNDVIALVVLDLTNPFFAEVAQGVARIASEDGFTLVVASSDGQRADEERDVQRLRDQGVAGLIVTPSGPDVDHLVTTSRDATPVVLLDQLSTDESLCSVSVDNVEGGRLAGRHLIGQGHSRIAFVSGPTTVVQAAQRREGLALACEQLRMDPTEVIVDVPVPAFTTSAGYLAASALLGQGSPTAAFCANDLLALGVERSLAEQGRKIPGDVAVLGYDDVDFTAIVPMPLSTVRQPKSLLGETAAKLLLDELQGHAHTHTQRVFAPELVIRQSTTG
jgi:LacI family transcriptional regulator